jgi:hypothetical protein
MGSRRVPAGGHNLDKARKLAFDKLSDYPGGPFNV